MEEESKTNDKGSNSQKNCAPLGLRETNCYVVAGVDLANGEDYTVETTQEDCWTCDGSGMVRRNYEKDGGYVFHKITCPDCGGSGVLRYRKCIDCGDVVPFDIFNDHACSNQTHNARGNLRQVNWDIPDSTETQKPIRSKKLAGLASG